jgi:hypothetical protein
MVFLDWLPASSAFFALGPPMRETADLWYLRLPNGRVLRAAGAAVVRQHLASGRIPAGTRMRRSLDEEWHSLERYPEFADLAPSAGENGLRGASTIRPAPERRADAPQAPPTIASRLDPMQLDQVGVRGLLEELQASLDSTAVPRKLFAALIGGIVLGVLLGLATLPEFTFRFDPVGPGWALVFGMILVETYLTSILVSLTFTEVSRLRPARWNDGLRGVLVFVARLVVLHVIALIVVGGTIFVARWLPGYLLQYAGAEGSTGWRIAAYASAVLLVFIEALAWVVALLLLPLGPLVVIEECSILAGLRRWLRLVRQHFGRLLVAEGMALSIGLILSLPMGLLLVLLGARLDADDELALAIRMALAIVAGLAGALLLAYLVVANVFIYLHLRYEPSRSR